MKYISTRDKQVNHYTFSDVLLQGLAKDGGLFVPEIYPHIDIETLKEYQSLPYNELAYKIISQFVGDSIPKDDLKQIVDKTYSTTHFKDKAITPVKKLYNNIFLQDLSLGPSLAFKDLALQFLGNIMEYELERHNKKITILGASSGDTVSAAEEAMKGKDRINVIMLTPETGMSDFQKAQAGSILDKNIFNLSLKGPFDTCQDLVKEINSDLSFKNTYQLSAVNSINWGRICAQVVYYIKGYLSVIEDIGDPIDVIVPSGNFGNVLAGYIAKQMGLPLRHLVVATNENRVLDTLFKTGIYKQESVKTTSSPSMDISKASNFERLLFDCFDRDAKKCSSYMKEFQIKKEIDLSEINDLLVNRIGFQSDVSTHHDRIHAIKTVYNDTNKIVDPHTAAGLHVALKNKDSEIPMLCMETAKATKFENTIQEALNFIPERDSLFKGLEEKEQRFYQVSPSVTDIKEFIKNNINI